MNKSGKTTPNLKDFKALVKNKQTISLDSMVFSYYFSGNKPYSELVEVLFDTQNFDGELNTSIISLIESLSYPQLETDQSKITSIQEFFYQQDKLVTKNISKEIVNECSKLRRLYKLSTPDSIQYATAIITQAQLFITNDQHFQRIKNPSIHIIFLDDYL